MSQSAYYCLDKNTMKIFTSRHVKFVENIFPYSKENTSSSSSNSVVPPTISTWIRPIIHFQGQSLTPSQLTHQQQLTSCGPHAPTTMVRLPAPALNIVQVVPNHLPNSQHHQEFRPPHTTNPVLNHPLQVLRISLQQIHLNSKILYLKVRPS